MGCCGFGDTRPKLQYNGNKALVLISMNIVSLSFGFTYGHLTGLVRALRSSDGEIFLSENQISLLAACMSFFSVTGILVLALFGEQIGRRWCFILFSILLLISWILSYYATGFITLLLSRISAGTAAGGLLIMNLVGTAEFTSPKSRAVFQSMVSMVTPALGTLLGHAVGVVIHWRTLTVAGMVIATVHIFLPYFWVESPQWLASRGRFQECETAFRKLHGDGPSARHEWTLLVKMESKKQLIAKETNATNGVKRILIAIKERYFWDLMLMNFFIYAYYSAAGKIVFSYLATVMLEEITGTPDVLVYMLLVDSFILIGTCASCVLIKKMSIRSLLFSSGVIANGILVLLSVCLYFKNDETYFQWLNVGLLALYFVIVHVGPYPIMEILYGELYPLDIKLFCYLMSTPVMLGTMSAGIMLMPILVKAVGYHGLFLLNSVIVFICLAYFWWRLPETKGKTLQEIEVYFKSRKFVDANRVLDSEQMRAFI